MLPIIQSLWIGNDLTNLEKLCVQSFLDNGHEFHLYTYADIGGIPNGAVVKDGNDILSADKIFQYKGGSYAGFANWFRYALLIKYGGWWVDMDLVCIKPFEFSNDIILAEELDVGYTNSVIKIPPNHSLMVTMEKFCRDFKDKEGAMFASVGGPLVLTEFAKKQNMQDKVLPHFYFHPIRYSEWQTAFDKTYTNDISFYESTHGIHFYNEMGRKNNFDKNARFDPDSLFEQLKTKHRIAAEQNTPTITSGELSKMIEAQNKWHKKNRQRRIKREVGWYLLVAFIVGFGVGSIY